MSPGRLLLLCAIGCFIASILPIQGGFVLFVPLGLAFFALSFLVS